MHDRESHYRILCSSKHDSSSALVRAFFLGTVRSRTADAAGKAAGTAVVIGIVGIVRRLLWLKDVL